MDEMLAEMLRRNVRQGSELDRKSTRLNSSHSQISYAAFFLEKIISLFFNDTATTEIYTLSLHDALPIWLWQMNGRNARGNAPEKCATRLRVRSEEHTSELQSQSNLVCRLLLGKNHISFF